MINILLSQKMANRKNFIKLKKNNFHQLFCFNFYIRIKKLNLPKTSQNIMLKIRN